MERTNNSSRGITIRELIAKVDPPKHRVFGLSSVVEVNPFNTCPNCYSSNISHNSRHDSDGVGYKCNNCSSTHYVWLCED